MAINFDAFTPDERDNFVKNVLSEKEMTAAISAFTGHGRKPREPEELLEFCFKVAVRKMKGLHRKIAEKRENAEA